MFYPIGHHKSPNRQTSHRKSYPDTIPTPEPLTEANEINILKNENKRLTDEIEQVTCEANALKEKNAYLINEMKQLRTETDEVDIKCKNLQSELSSFTKYKSVKKVKRIVEHLETFNEQLNSIIEELTNDVRKLDRNKCLSVIGQQMVQYRKYRVELSDAGVEFHSEPDFPSMISNYRKACEVNDANIKDIFKLLYEVSKGVNHRTDKFASNIDGTLRDMEHFTEEQSKVLNKLEKKSVQHSMDIEKQLYAVISEGIKTRISFFDLLKVENNRAEVKGKNIEMDCQRLIGHFKDATDSGENNVILYNIWETEDGENELPLLFKLNDLD